MSRPAVVSLTALVAVAGTAAGVLALFFAQSALSPTLLGGPGAVCAAPDCALGAGVWLIVGGFLAVLVSLVASLVVGLRKGDRPVARGLLVCFWCLLAYLAESIVLWVLV